MNDRTVDRQPCQGKTLHTFRLDAFRALCLVLFFSSDFCLKTTAALKNINILVEEKLCPLGADFW